MCSGTHNQCLRTIWTKLGLSFCIAERGLSNVASEEGKFGAYLGTRKLWVCTWKTTYTNLTTNELPHLF